MKKTCAKCHQSFECLMEDIKNCHCSNIVLSKTALEAIAENYDNCLCNECLQAIASVETE
ncbi:MAG: hypothetical protein GQ574_08145 [Crocinitomix sp.]|nr:hypothetical protein [Crocinitomix sp.]